MSTTPKDVKTIFLDAVERKDPGERDRFLDEACAGDSALRRRVEELLASYEQAGSFMENKPAGAFVPTLQREPIAERPGSVIGPYKLLQEIGEGGFGVVYMAEQTEPLRRRVALKIIKPGTDTREVIARFEAERQALALMDHPNIAKVLDAGATGSGRPYFVMELVKGIPITKYCDEKRLSPNQRLDLFLHVCQAVQHAHQKGIIHRDLKPSNVLVALYDGRPVPKVIDFGVAKATSHKLTERTMFTHFGQIVGTLEYMSPEQAELNQLDIDTRSDIYSLGVMLYELMTGTMPFDRRRLRSAAFEEMLRIIREEEPPKPSTRLSASDTLPAIAASRRTDPKKLTGLVRGDLDWIVMKTLAKERHERYQTATALADDIQRHLDDQPIEARRPSALGRVRRFVRRQKLPVALAAGAFASLVTAISLAVVAHVGELERQLADRRLMDFEAKEQRQDWARRIAIPDINQSLIDEHLIPAFRLAKEAKQVLPEDPTLAELWNQLTTTATVDSEPSGASVFIRDWDDLDEQWLKIGNTPLKNVSLPKGMLRWKFILEGHVTRELNAYFPDIASNAISLPEDSDVPPGMVHMPPGTVGEFLIDRFEVTNSAFQSFVDQGGYRNREYWLDLVDAITIPWEQAMEQFCDKTGKPGPATWADGRYPDGQDDYPVCGVSWYEASAYARFAAKSLPTIRHWAWAAGFGGGRKNLQQYVVPLSNFSRRGPAPVGEHIGIGRFDVYDMAGNVKEWCWNETEQKHRWIRGGAWNEPGYMFGARDADAPFARLKTYGFRCVKYVDAPPPEAMSPTRRTHRAYDEEAPASSEQIKAYKRHYIYERTAPLNAEARPRVDDAEHYRHEVVGIDAAYSGERFDLHLFIPRGASPPYDAVVIFPGADALEEISFDDHIRLGSFGFVKGLVEEGWTACWPVYKRMFERNGGFRVRELVGSSVRGRDTYIQMAKDLSRTVDYLRMRGDINSNRLAYVGLSMGAAMGPVMVVVEDRFKAAVWISGGLFWKRKMPEVEPFLFASHVQMPVLMLNGRYDQIFPFESSQALYERLRTPDKQIIRFDTGHAIPIDQTVNVANEWLREKLSEQ